MKKQESSGGTDLTFCPNDQSPRLSILDLETPVKPTVQAPYSRASKLTITPANSVDGDDRSNKRAMTSVSKKRLRKEQTDCKSDQSDEITVSSKLALKRPKLQ